MKAKIKHVTCEGFGDKPMIRLCEGLTIGGAITTIVGSLVVAAGWLLNKRTTCWFAADGIKQAEDHFRGEADFLDKIYSAEE